jgi:hypothetical protein
MSTRRPWKFRTSPATAILDQPDAMRQESWHTSAFRLRISIVPVLVRGSSMGPSGEGCQPSPGSSGLFESGRSGRRDIRQRRKRRSARSGVGVRMGARQPRELQRRSRQRDDLNCRPAHHRYEDAGSGIRRHPARVDRATNFEELDRPSRVLPASTVGISIATARRIGGTKSRFQLKALSVKFGE